MNLNDKKESQSKETVTEASFQFHLENQRKVKAEFPLHKVMILSHYRECLRRLTTDQEHLDQMIGEIRDKSPPGPV